MSANINDLITAARDTVNPTVTTVSSARSIGGTSLSCVDLAGWPTNTAVHFFTYKKTPTGTIDKATQCDWKGIVSGNTIGTLTLKNGTDAGNDDTYFVEMAPTAAWGEDLYNGLTAQHNIDGTHKGITTDTLTVSSNVTLPTGSIQTAALADGAVTGAKLDGTYAIAYQKDSGNTISSVTGTDVHMMCGWGQVVGTGVGSLTDTLTFPTAFSTEVISVMVTLNGYGTSSPGSSLNAATGNWGAKSATATAHNITTSGCIIELGQSTGTFTSGTYFYYSWVAYGR